MELSLLLMEKILSMAVMIAIGFAATKFKVINTETSSHLSKLCIYVICPCVFISSLQREMTPSVVSGILVTLAAGVIAHVIFIVFTHVIALKIKMKPVEIDSLIYSNAGNLIIPLITYIFGKDTVIFCTSFFVVQVFLVFTHGVFVLGGRSEVSIKKIFTNPNIIAVIVGLIFFVTGFSIPSIPMTALSGIADLIGPVSMIIIGIGLANADLKSVFTNKRAYIVCFGRLILLPLIVILVFKFSGFYKITPEAADLLVITMLATAAPAAATVTQLAQLYNRDYTYASCINVMSVVACIITMPLMILVYQLICM